MRKFNNISDFLKLRRNLAYCETKSELFQDLVRNKATNSPFDTFAEAFEFSLLIGYNMHLQEPLQKRTTNIPTTALSDLGKQLIVAIGILSELDFKVLLEEDYDKVFEIAEEFANGGVTLLHEEIVKNQANALPPLKLHIWQERLIRETELYETLDAK